MIALFVEGPTTILNMYLWWLKETERTKDTVTECTKLVATEEKFRNYCGIHLLAENLD